MDCFTTLLQVQGRFEFHPQCEEIGLTKLNFADDLFVLSAATEKSMKLIRRVLKEFGEISRLHSNLTKSTSYFIGMKDQEATRLSGILDIPIAEISVKYLEIPLTTKQIKAADCKILLEKIKGKINSWGSKFLSFARRLVLIQAVMFYIYNYWCQVVFLPKQVIKEVESMFNSFPWKGVDSGRFLPKVSWKQATLRRKRVELA
ncbi:reverse transcriptase [Lithospermum erythrorhizon]|uniref:Reverse transcriptase n=1 Tax=Lithospermum erythrorhizon TaxID=34254 RepID=A0AAV3PYA8_LITER